MDNPKNNKQNVIQQIYISLNRFQLTTHTLHTCPSESTCQAVRHGVHNKCPQGSILMSLSFSAHILHNWNVLPVNID